VPHPGGLPAQHRVLVPEHRQVRPHDPIFGRHSSDDVLPDGVTGELCCRGPYTIPGYYDAAEHNAAAFTSDGYYRTGDLASVQAAVVAMPEPRLGERASAFLVASERELARPRSRRTSTASEWRCSSG
jgi:non-ribosomal peptide synthetase component E (peptide arylation enzyme)